MSEDGASVVGEGPCKKGGVNEKPSCPRPSSPPKGRRPEKALRSPEAPKTQPPMPPTPRLYLKVEQLVFSEREHKEVVKAAAMADVSVQRFCTIAILDYARGWTWG